MKKLDVRKLAQFIWEVERHYQKMFHEYDDPRDIYESWDDAGQDEQDGCVDKITQMLFAGPDRIEERIKEMEDNWKQDIKEYADSNDPKKKRKFTDENYTSAKIFLTTLKNILETCEFTDRDHKEINTSWLH